MNLKNWTAEILLECKRIFGIQHDATEQEIHESLREIESHEDLKTSIIEEFKTDSNAPTEKETELEAKVSDMQAQVDDLKSQLESAQQTIDNLTAEKKDLESKGSALQAEIDQLKEEPADKHTGGDNPPPGKSKTPVWDNFKEKHGL